MLTAETNIERIMNTTVLVVFVVDISFDRLVFSARLPVAIRCWTARSDEFVRITTLALPWPLDTTRLFGCLTPRLTFCRTTFVLRRPSFFHRFAAVSVP